MRHERSVLISWIAPILILCPAHSLAQSVVLLRPERSAFQRNYSCGFTYHATARVSAFEYDAKNEKALITRIKKVAPDLIFSTGPFSTQEFVKAFPSTPILTSSSLSEGAAPPPNLIRIESDRVVAGLDLIPRLFPRAKTVGCLYNPKHSQDKVSALVARAAELGLKIASIMVDAPGDVQGYVNAFAGKIDAFYWFPDPTTADEAALKAIYDFAARNAVPVFTHDPSQMKRGALAAVNVDPFELGRKAWETAKGIIEDKKLPKEPVRMGAMELSLTLSLEKAGQFGIGAEDLSAFLRRMLKDGCGVRLEP